MSYINMNTVEGVEARQNANRINQLIRLAEKQASTK